MKTEIKKITREKFVMAISGINEVLTKYPNTKLSHWCLRFIELNEKVSKENDKKQRKLTRDLANELRDFKRMNALEKDGVAVFKKNVAGQETNEPEPKDAAAAVAIFKKQDEISDRIEDVLSPFLEEEIEVRCFVSETELPKDYNMMYHLSLNGIVYTNKMEIEETE